MDETVSVFHVDERAEHFFNRNRHSSMLGLGCLFESLHIAASRDGYELELIELSPDAKGSQPVLRARLKYSGCGEDELLAHLQNRQTTRTPFNRTDLEVRIREGILRQTDRFKQVKFHLLTHPTGELVSQMAVVESFLWYHPAAAHDVLKWLRLTPIEFEASADGVPWAALGISSLQAKALDFIRRFPSSLSFLRFLALARGTRRQSAKNISTSAALLLFSAPVASAENLFVAGRASLRCWVFLNSHSFGVQPLTQSSLLLTDVLEKEVAESSLHPKLRPQLEAALGQVRQGFGCDENARPLWLLRTGITSTPTGYKRSKRLHQKVMQRFYADATLERGI